MLNVLFENINLAKFMKWIAFYFIQKSYIAKNKKGVNNYKIINK